MRAENPLLVKAMPLQAVAASKEHNRQSKSARRRRDLQAVALMAVALGLASTTAQAQTETGSWVAAPSMSKSNPKGIPLSEMLSGSTTFNDKSVQWQTNGLPGDRSSQWWPQGGSGKVTGSQVGTQTLWLVFVPATPGQVPPDKVSVLLTITGSASAMQLAPIGGDYKRTVSVSVAGESGSEPGEIKNSGGDSFLESLLERRLIKQVSPQKRDDGKYYLSLPVQVNNTASIDGPRVKADGTPLTGGSIGCQYTASMQKDTRFLTISRGVGASPQGQRCARSQD